MTRARRRRRTASATPARRRARPPRRLPSPSLVPRPEHRDIALQRLDVLREFLLRERLRGGALARARGDSASSSFCDIADEEGRGGSARADIAAAAAAAAVASAAASCVRTSDSAAFEAAASALAFAQRPWRLKKLFQPPRAPAASARGGDRRRRVPRDVFAAASALATRASAARA